MKMLLFGIVLGLALFGDSVMGQGNLEPSSPPGPTMKTLQQVEPRIPVSGPGTLSSPGSYYFTNNIQGAITITSGNVDLDLQGFALNGNFGLGITVSGVSNIKISNGSIFNATLGGAGGVMGNSAGSVLVQDVRIINSYSCGVFNNPTGTIEFNRVLCEVTTADGLLVSSNGGNPLRAIVRDSTFRFINQSGPASPAISLVNTTANVTSAIVTGNRISSANNDGIVVDTDTVTPGPTSGAITDNVVGGSLGTGIRVEGQFAVARNLAQGNTDNYDLSLAPNAAPISSLGASPGAWDNISE